MNVAARWGRGEERKISVLSRLSELEIGWIERGRGRGEEYTQNECTCNVLFERTPTRSLSYSLFLSLFHAEIYKNNASFITVPIAQLDKAFVAMQKVVGSNLDGLLF